MKRTAYIRIKGHPDTLYKIMQLFEDSVDEIRNDPGGLQITIDEDRSEYKDLKSIIKKENLDNSFSEKREYTKQEINNAEYFHIGVAYPWEHDPMKDAEYYGTKYEYLKNKSCQCNKIQVSKLQFDVKKLGKWNIAHIRPEYIITEYTKLLIESNQLSGCEIRQASDYKGRELQQVYQLVITNIVPPMHEGVRYETNPYHIDNNCGNCSSKGFPRSELIYRKEELEKFKDFNLTFEYLNAYNNRLPIVSAKVRKLFTTHKVKVFRFEPVRFI
jgi:hypothetical protein